MKYYKRNTIRNAKVEFYWEEIINCSLHDEVFVIIRINTNNNWNVPYLVMPSIRGKEPPADNVPESS